MSRMNRRKNKRPRKPRAVKVQVNPHELPDVRCHCGHRYFKKRIRVKKVSALMPENPTGKDQYPNFVVLVCGKCGSEFDIEKAIITNISAGVKKTEITP